MNEFPTTDDRLDALVDKDQISYTEAYGELGLPVPEYGTPPTPDAAGKQRAADHEYYANEFGLTGTEPLTPEQIATNKAGADAVRAALRDAQDQEL